jgi:hypothetical protein
MWSIKHKAQFYYCYGLDKKMGPKIYVCKASSLTIGKLLRVDWIMRGLTSSMNLSLISTLLKGRV